VTAARPGGYAVFKNRDFALFLGSRFFAAIATQMLIMAVGWQVYHITGLDLFAVLFGGATALLPAYTRDVLHAGPEGTTAAWFGLVPAIVLGGVATILVTVLWSRVLFPQLWHMQTFRHSEVYEADAT
jgi:hypothetical protein